MRWTRYWLEVTIALLLLWWPWSLGLRLTPESAARARPSLPKEAQYVTSFEWEHGQALVYADDAATHYTLRCRRLVMVWQCTVQWVEQHKDWPVRVVGAISWRSHGQIQAIQLLKPIDPRISRIAFRFGDKRQEVGLIPGQLSTMRWSLPEITSLSSGETYTSGGLLLYRGEPVPGSDQFRWVFEGTEPPAP